MGRIIFITPQLIKTMGEQFKNDIGKWAVVINGAVMVFGERLLEVNQFLRKTGYK